MTKPDVGAVTRADEVAMSVRPYVNLVTPLSMLDWSWSRNANGSYELDYIKYIEETNGDIQVTREWTREFITTWEVDTAKKQILNQIIEVNGLGKIPAVIAYSQRSTVRGIGISDIQDIADAQKFIYNNTSEVEQSIRLDSHPSLVKTPETQAGIGPGSIISMPENIDPGLKPYVLEFSGASVAAIYSAIQHSIDSIDKMANTGSVRATTSRTMSGVAMQTEFQLLNSRLAEKADNLELCEEQMWRLWTAYMGHSWNGSVDYPGSFNIQDTQNEFKQLIDAKSAATDPRVFQLIDHEIVGLLGEDADIVLPEQATLATGETVPLDSTEPFEDPERLFNPATGEYGWVIDFQAKRDAMVAGWVESEE
jgi:hypothetical protein